MAITEEIHSRLENKRIFLTGATGFFGRSILDFLLKQKIPNLHIHLLCREPEAFFKAWPKYKKIDHLTYTKGDIEQSEIPKENFDFLLHFATPASAKLNIEDPLKMNSIIINGQNRILEMATKCNVKKVLFASSGAVYGKQPPELSHVNEDYAGAPLVHKAGSAYGEAKRMAELIGCESARRHGFEFKIARCFAFTGPHLDPHGTFAIGNFIANAIDGKSIDIAGDGTPYRSYLYSDDLTLWLFKILLDGRNLEPYNVGSDHAVSIRELAHKIADIINPKLEINIAKTADKNRLADRYVPSVDKARKELGLEVWTDLESAILKTHAGYLSLRKGVLL